MVVSGNEKPSRTRRWILYDVLATRRHGSDHEINDASWCEVLTCSSLLLGGVSCEYALVDIAKALVVERVPVDCVDRSEECGKHISVSQRGSGFVEDAGRPNVL